MSKQRTCKKTMPNRMPQAISTFFLSRTMATPPSWPTRLMTTKRVARNQPQPHEMSMYSLCSPHCTHMRMPSSKKVDTRQKRARWGSTCLEWRVTCKNKKLARTTKLVRSSPPRHSRSRPISRGPTPGPRPRSCPGKPSGWPRTRT